MPPRSDTNVTAGKGESEMGYMAQTYSAGPPTRVHVNASALSIMNHESHMLFRVARGLGRGGSVKWQAQGQNPSADSCSSRAIDHALAASPAVVAAPLSLVQSLVVSAARYHMVLLMPTCIIHNACIASKRHGIAVRTRAQPQTCTQDQPRIPSSLEVDSPLLPVRPRLLASSTNDARPIDQRTRQRQRHLPRK